MPLRRAVERIELAEGEAQALVGILDRRPGREIRDRVGCPPMRVARLEQRHLVGEVAVDGRAANAGVARPRRSSTCGQDQASRAAGRRSR